MSEPTFPAATAPGSAPGNALPESPNVGTSVAGPGVSGRANTGVGVYGQSIGLVLPTHPGVVGEDRPPSDGVFGEGANGVHGRSTTNGTGVWGESDNGYGVLGASSKSDAVVGITHANSKSGVLGETDDGAIFGAGVTGTSKQSHGVHGRNGIGSGQSSLDFGAGVWGESDNGYGVYGASGHGDAVVGITHDNSKSGVLGKTDDGAVFGAGVTGTSKQSHGVHGRNGAGSGQASLDFGAGLWGESDNGYGVYGASTNGFAAHFEGRVQINGTLTMGNNGDVVLADFAEDFSVSCSETEPGTVMVIDQDGDLRACDRGYDQRVAGVISGGGNFRPGIVLGRTRTSAKAVAIALVGKVYCNVDATYSPIVIGDMLTSSPTLGHAMKVGDPCKAFGAVIGKALSGLETGRAIIPILVALQ